MVDEAVAPDPAGFIFLKTDVDAKLGLENIN